MRLVWIGIGTKEPERMYQSVKTFHETLEKAGIKHVYYESPGTDHEWQTWRRSLASSRRDSSTVSRVRTHEKELEL